MNLDNWASRLVETADAVDLEALVEGQLTGRDIAAIVKLVGHAQSAELLIKNKKEQTNE